MSVVSLRDRQEERDARRLLGMMLDGDLEQAATELVERGIRARRIAGQRKATLPAASVSPGIPASCRDEPKDRHQPGEQGEEG